jgi:hypothetical protein
MLPIQDIIIDALKAFSYTYPIKIDLMEKLGDNTMCEPPGGLLPEHGYIKSISLLSTKPGKCYPIILECYHN